MYLPHQNKLVRNVKNNIVMKNVIDINTTRTLARFAEAFEVYQREYNRKSESEIKEEKAKFEHCLQLV